MATSRLYSLAKVYSKPPVIHNTHNIFCHLAIIKLFVVISSLTINNTLACNIAKIDVERTSHMTGNKNKSKLKYMCCLNVFRKHFLSHQCKYKLPSWSREAVKLTYKAEQSLIFFFFRKFICLRNTSSSNVIRFSIFWKDSDKIERAVLLMHLPWLQLTGKATG